VSLRSWWPAALCAALAAAGVDCRREVVDTGELHAQRVVLEHEVAGLRDAVARLEHGESLLPPDDVAVGIDDRMLRELIAAQLPLDVDVDRFHVRLSAAEVRFRGSPLVRLRGSGFLREQPAVSAVVGAIAALDPIRIEPESGTLHAKLTLEHIEIERSGLEALLSGAARDALARRLRRRLEGELPDVQIPIRVQQAVVLPALTHGPVRIDAAQMPIEVGVSRAYAGQGMLWIGVSVRPGALARTGRTP